MDKQKQIEEMAKVYDEATYYARNYLGSLNNAGKWYGNAFYNAGYRKIPENAVVLTREEYEKLKDEKADNILANVDKVFKAEFADMKNSVIRRINKDYAKKVRKETAEKLLNKVDYESNGQTKAITDLLRKEYGVETK